jgi:hypothetical protein
MLLTRETATISSTRSPQASRKHSDWLRVSFEAIYWRMPWFSRDSDKSLSLMTWRYTVHWMMASGSLNFARLQSPTTAGSTCIFETSMFQWLRLDLFGERVCEASSSHQDDGWQRRHRSWCGQARWGLRGSPSGGWTRLRFWWLLVELMRAGCRRIKSDKRICLAEMLRRRYLTEGFDWPGYRDRCAAAGRTVLVRWRDLAQLDVWLVDMFFPRPNWIL